MNIWSWIAIGLVAAGVMVMPFIYSQPTLVPQIFKTNTMEVIWNAYRQAVYPTEDQQAKVVDLTGWKTAFGTQALVVTGRFLHKGRVIEYRTWRVISPLAVSYPFLVEFDLNGDGTFSESEGNILIGDLLTTAPIPEAVYLAGQK